MKFDVTPELVTLLKTIRTQNNISSKELAEYIGKSPSYVSKLENGDFTSIKKDDLTDILSYITDGEDFYRDKMPNMLRVLKSFLNPDNLCKQIWLIQYDTIERSITIPREMADDISVRMNKLNLKPGRLAEIINTNIDSEMSSLFPANEIIAMEYKEGSLLLVRMEVKKEQIIDIITKNNLNTNYSTIHAIAFNLLKLQKYGENRMPPDQAKEVLRETGQYLEQYDLHSLISFNKFLSSGEFLSQQESLVYSFDSVNSEVISEIVEIFKEASEHDKLMATQALYSFKNSLKWDPGFMLKLISLNYDRLNGLSYAKKKKLMDDIAALLERCEQMSDFEKKLESY